MGFYLFIYLFMSTVLYAEDWPQAFGPNDDFTVNGKAVDSFSVSMN